MNGEQDETQKPSLKQMKVHVTNLHELRAAVSAIDLNEILVLVLHTPGQQAFRFIVTRNGIEREQCTSSGESLR